MKPTHPAWNWTLLLLLGISSGMVCWTIYQAVPSAQARPSPYAFDYSWAGGIFFGALTMVIFLLCLRDANERRAAFAAFGISVLLSGPVYLLNAERLAQISPVSWSWQAPHLPFGLIFLCWLASAGIVIWWLVRSTSIKKQGPAPLLLFGGIVFVLLLVPALTNRLGIESLRFFTALPASADAVRNTPDGVTRLCVDGMTATIGNVIAYLVQWLGIIGTLLMIGVVMPGVIAVRYKKANDDSEVAAFPSRCDLLPLVFLALAGLLFPVIASAMHDFAGQVKDVAKAAHQPIYGCSAGILIMHALTGLIFIVGSWMVLRRIQAAPQIRFGFTFLALTASLLVSGTSLYYAPHATKIIGAAGLALAIAQVVTFVRPARRAVWRPSVFATPGETALSFATQGSLIFAVLASIFLAIALELAFISVFAIKYLIDWGNAIKPLHGVAPTWEIAPTFAPSLSTMSVLLGPGYFALCVVLGVVTALVFSLVYSGCQGCGKLYRRVMNAPQTGTPAADDYSGRLPI